MQFDLNVQLFDDLNQPIFVEVEDEMKDKLTGEITKVATKKPMTMGDMILQPLVQSYKEDAALPIKEKTARYALKQKILRHDRTKSINLDSTELGLLKKYCGMLLKVSFWGQFEEWMEHPLGAASEVVDLEAAKTAAAAAKVAEGGPATAQ